MWFLVAFFRGFSKGWKGKPLSGRTVLLLMLGLIALFAVCLVSQAVGGP